MYKYRRRKELIKNFIYIFFILQIAVISTYYIYNKFQDDRSIDFNSESLDVTYHETTGDKILINKITPVTDSVGLSSKAYIISVKNNLTEKVNYKIRIVDDLEKMKEDGCEESIIPKEDIKISINVNKKGNKIYRLDELEKGILLDEIIPALQKDNISIRTWIKQDTKLPTTTIMHYHGLIQIIEDDNNIAINR